MDTAYQREFQVRDLGTRSVTLFPTRAQVVREIKATLVSGACQITIAGLSPSVDEHSIKVEGTGSAIITDIAVENRPNREIFQDVYPEYDESDSDSASESDEDEGIDSEDPALREIREKMEALLDDQKRAKEKVASAGSRLQILDAYGRMITTLPSSNEASSPNHVDIASSLDTYRTAREKMFQDSEEGSIKERELARQIKSLKKEESRVSRLLQKEKARADKAKFTDRRAKRKEEQKEARRQDKIDHEKGILRREREWFWPKNVFVVKVSLEVVNLTPTSSRRASISSDRVSLAAESSDKTVDDTADGSCDILLTYVTSYAYWSPSYDLALSTTANSGTLLFDAHLMNRTSETWSNCKIILSTSQADFSGLDNKIPSLVPWRMRLASKGAFNPPTKASNEVMYSSEEQSQKASWTAYQNMRNTHKPRGQLFGVDNTNAFGGFGAKPAFVPPQNQQFNNQGFGNQGFGNQGFGNQNKPVGDGGLFGNKNANNTSGFGSATTNVAGGLFGGSGSTPQGGGLFGAPAASSVFKETLQVDDQVKTDLSPEELRYASGGFGAAVEAFDATAFVENQPELDFQESSFEETGLTSTYELPGLKTLIPSSTTSKQRVAKVTFASVNFSHTVIAKYKPAAYLKASLRNGSKLTLLRGPAGLTLDGSFLGRTQLPRCSPGDSFNLSLGIDPAIRVAYPKPDIKRSQSGLFSKEDSSAYTRTITLSNTRSGGKVKPAIITVMDQVPISEDEKLRIDILQPRGLVLGSGGIPAGVSGRQGKDQADWGKAVAHLKKGGEISWDVRLNAGRMVRLGLEYECSFPAGEHAVNV